MFVSLLQLMGFPMGKPVHSRAEETPVSPSAKAGKGAAATRDHAQASTARRQEVKANSGKDTKAKAVKAKDAKTKVSAKPSAKAPAKPAAKPAVKAAAQKVVAKPAVKATSKAAAKPVAKPVAKAVKTSKPVAKAPAKTAAKAAPKVAAKPAAKIKAPAEKPAAKPAAKVPTPSASKPSPAKAAVVVAAAPVPAVPAKSGRPSSRLAQLTVPSMAQTVASTAAKATYTLTMSSPVIAPVIPSIAKKDAKLANNWKSKPAAELTDAELLAMPDSEYMNEVQLAAFRLKLTILKRDILNSAGETTEHLREDTSVVPDPADRATIEEEHALELRTRDRERKLLKKIEQSIARIDAGDYGYCDETGEPIGVGRLLARPTATLSLEAQQRRELKQKMFGD
jgi:DnaK suppressor protein